jgi:hypothetical protein
VPPNDSVWLLPRNFVSHDDCFQVPLWTTLFSFRVNDN